MKQRKLTILLLILGMASISAQNTITGVVTDKTGLPLPGVNIIIKGTTTGASTDFDGVYSLNASQGDTMEFSYIGYITSSIVVGSNKIINVRLEEDTQKLDEVVVVGYGTQKKVNVTGAVSTIDTEDIVRTPSTNVKNLFIGQTSGVITNQNPGLPGRDNVGISIRGFQGNPLVIVDGVESSLDRLDQNDIENISILKDASAAIYGVRGGDGVILITTKRGKAGKVQLNYHGFTGIQHVTRFPDPIDAAGYIEAHRNSILNTFYDRDDPDATIPYGGFTEELVEDYRSGRLPSYNWADAILRGGGGLLTSHNINASGGSENINFYSSFGITEQNTVFNGDYAYNKINLTNNLDANLSDNLTLSINTSYIREIQDYPSQLISELWNDMRTAQPIYNPNLPDPTRAAYSGFSQRSPLARMSQSISGYEYTRIQTLAAAGDLKYNFPFAKGLAIGVRANVRLRDLYRETLTKRYSVYSYDEDTDTYSVEGTFNDNPTFRKATYFDFVGGLPNPNSRLLSRLYTTYDKSFGDHEIGVLAFVEKQDDEFNSLSALRLNLLSDDVPTIEAGDNGLTEVGGNAKPIEFTRVSVAGRLNYSYMNKYLLEVAVRADASSNLAPGIRWGYFPSVSLGWNIANEDFMKDSSFKQLKLRLSYSETGRDVLNPLNLDFLTGYEDLGNVYYLDGEPISRIRTAGLINPNLSWEEITNYNIGVDFNLMNGKLYGNVDAFYRFRDGITGQAIAAVPSTFGASLPAVNINSRSDRGIEALVGYRGNIGDLKFDVSGNITYAREKYEDQQQDIDFDDPNQVRIDQLSGRYVNRTFGYISDGLINSNDELDDYVNNHTFEGLNGGAPQLGDIRYKDVSGPDGTPDGVINRYDIREIGYGNLPDLTFGLNTRLTYKSFSLAMLWQGASMFNVSIAGIYQSPFANEVVPLRLHQEYSWTQDPNNPGVGNNQNAQLPAYTRDGGRQWNNDNFSDFWLKDATYIRLKTATLSYNVNDKILDKTGFKKIEIYATGDNLLNFSDLGIFNDYIDPEQAFTSGGYSIPLLRTYSLGLRLSL